MSTGYIAGRALYPDGRPHKGTTRLLSAAPVRDTDSDLVATYSGATYLELDDDGGFVFEVPASDDPAYDPGGVTYALYYPESAGLPPVIGIWVPTGETILVGGVIPLDPQAPSYAQQVSLADFNALLDRLAELEEIVANLGTGPTPGPVEDSTAPGLYSTTGTTETTPGLYAPTGLVEDPTAPSLYLIGA